MATMIWNGAAGDNTWATAGNWEGGAAPGANDSVIFPAMTHATTTDVQGDTVATALSAVTVMPGCGVWFGSDAVDAAGTGRLLLSITGTGAKTFDYAGSGLAYISVTGGAGPVGTCTITNCASAGVGDYGLNLSGSLILDLNVNMPTNCKLGLACRGGETAAFTNIRVAGGGEVNISDGVTATLVQMSGGKVYNYAALTNAYVDGGILYQQKGAIATLLRISANGKCVYNSTGTCADCDVWASHGLDLSQDIRAKTFTHVDAYVRDAVYCPYGTGAAQIVTFSQGIDFHGCAPEGLTPDATWTASSL